jgi:ATP-binding cassette subfamily F protein 3
MISINNLSYFIGGRAIYQNASLHIRPKDKIGLIGLNGTGKTTLLRIINGEYKPDEGEVTRSRDCSIGYLNQDLLSFQSDDPILLVAMQAFEKELKLQRKIDDLLKKLENHYDEKLAMDLSHAQEEFAMMDGYSIQAKAEEILEGIGFQTAELQKPLHQFSGGWRMRVMLAKLLLENPSLLMLDEPTNHLDLPSIQWVENYLKNYDGAVIIVSHDKQFLDNTINRTVEVAFQQLNSYEGNYTFYDEEKALRMEIQKNAFENQQQKIKQTERFINRFRAKASKARQVQSKMKSLERMDKVEDVVDANAKVNFRFDLARQSGRFVVNLENISKQYGDLVILKNTDATIERGDKIALIGANGKGKSTLLRIITGMEKHQGKAETGYNVHSAFYAQHQIEALKMENEVLEEVKSAGPQKTELELRSMLGNFLFTEDDVFKKVKVLSGGEKSRVALAKVLLSEANFLILDEPTNHLDFQSVQILIQALQQYEGTLIFVSHDRYFISEVSNKIWWLENQEIKSFPGNYEEYHYWNSKRSIQPQVKKTEKPEPEPVKEKKPVNNNNNQAIDKEKQKLVKKLEKEIAELEDQIIKLETEIKELEKAMATEEVFSDPGKLEATNLKYAKTRQIHQDTSNTWEERVEELEKYRE